MSTEGSEGPELGDPLLYLAENFENLYNRALDGKPAQLKALFGPSSRWEGVPMAEQSGDVQSALDQVDQARAFFLEPRLSVTGSRVLPSANTVEVEWQLSGTWPLPYRPRVRAAGTTVMRIDAAHKGPQPRVLLMEERWDKPWWRSSLEQALPRAWDMWHLFLTPPSEKPLYRVVRRFHAIELREYYPRLVVELETQDTREGKKFTDLAWVLPDFGFTDELKLQGRAQYRETYVTTSPLEVCVESTEWAPPGGQPVPSKRVRWHVPLPSHVGLNASALPEPMLSPNATMGEVGRYVLQPRRLVAVRPFSGQAQTANYGNARRWLLEFVKREGLRTVRNERGRSPVWVLRNNMKAGFNMAGHFCLGIYEQPSYSERGEIAVEIDPESVPPPSG